jgi:hypothetical protein
MTDGEKRQKKKLRRTETIGFRLEPKLRFAAELAARKQRRSLSSFIEWAVEEAVKKVALKTYESSNFNEPDRDETAYDAINLAWDVDEADRFAKLAFNYPFLLDHEEEVLWKLVRLRGWFWKGRYDDNDEWLWKTDERSLVFDRLREHWDILKMVAKGELTENSLPELSRKGNSESNNEPESDSSDDDIPF